ncbi:M20/M25/M40 family metallo-hydrolase [Micromonospora aurantiaca]|uniref:M20/M25/M40 family metallo-hydrolase n=1 Tax=Micromonospora aurantiaca (nom. illeg.) TaxID=47850 RepID=A0A1C6SDB6_9ACTN|nr:MULTISPECIES: M20/M25/M40 family metallo-hydrolase [Micromonospora]ADL46441.1 peptidase M20 [Micromonospora aurantiaca ATCC 27029]ADU10951.1 peptidase M20 [Micromonospora sp. L5]AXH92425.1 M20/M25/M40 family metallo-hydrolase [Micromonospora aurantiaca]KAB1108467.1 M20/M25/M40 family metallo-hydrolase [Micromonospora aurantiaca]MBC9004488.1 M20/M25/M40 family metallo-hydrolase [Micromonospora aurantiaca]
MTSDAAPARPDATDEVVDLCRDLLRIDTTNTGDNDTSAGERRAAEYVAEKLAEVGVDAEIHESAPGRANLVARIPGTEPGRDALLVHGHLDVVPADPDEWSVHPFSGEIRDGYLWGRGAIDMKDFDAMVLAVVRDWQRTGVRPRRDVVLAFTADEEAGSDYGAHFLTRRHRDLFDGCTEAIGEVGGFSYSVDEQRRLYLIETAEKGIDWLRLHAKGRPGHGSMVHDDNAVTALAEAVARIGRHRFPVVMTDTVRAFLAEVSDVLGIEIDPDDPETAIAKLGPIANIIGATVRNTANPTRLAAGYKDNVIPGRATATIDCRSLPGQSEELERQLRELVGPDIAIEYVQRQPALETTFDGDLVAHMSEALRAEDPGAHPVPYMLSGGTDAKAFSQLGIRCFGFAPLRLPADLNFSGLFHGIDERVPLDGLQFGVRVLDRFLRTC